MKPIRIQRKRTKGWKIPPNTIVVSRPSRWGNPYRVGDFDINGKKITRETAIEWYRKWLYKDLNFCGYKILDELKGKNLACWCKLTAKCHADVLLDIANI